MEGWKFAWLRRASKQMADLMFFKSELTQSVSFLILHPHHPLPLHRPHPARPVPQTAV